MTPVSTSESDRDHMAAALELARAMLGRVWPNPAVGCRLVRDGSVIAEAATAETGRPHGEALALRRAGERARGATAYVTLEPCSHHGRTPPCADALAEAGIARCVVALGDPDPRVDGRGLARLRAAGIAVSVGLLEAEAATVNAGFLHRARTGRPLAEALPEADLPGLADAVVAAEADTWSVRLAVPRPGVPLAWTLEGADAPGLLAALSRTGLTRIAVAGDGSAARLLATSGLLPAGRG